MGDMERLETILRELVVSEQGLNALFTVLKSSEEYYDAAGTEELNAVIFLIKKYTEMLLNQLANSIIELDRYLLEQE